MSEYIITTEQLAMLIAKCGVKLVDAAGTSIYCSSEITEPIVLKEIVRCRSCRFYECGDDGWWCLRSISTKGNHPDGFCKWGEKR